MKNVAMYVGKYAIEGVDKYTLPNKQMFICAIAKPHHLIETFEVYTSRKTKGTYVYCQTHKEFVDVAEREREQ